MSTLTPGAFTYAEWALRHGPDGKLSTLVDLRSQSNEILKDSLAVECQSGNAFEFTQVTSLPTIGTRSYNQGVARTIATVAKQVATCAEYADWSFFDASLATLGGDLAQLRFMEDSLHMESMSQQVASDMFYGNAATNPTKYTGLANIYNTVTTSTSQIARNVIDCGGTGSTNTSLWLLNWGPRAIHTIFPRGLPTGMQHKDFGLLPALDGASLEFPAYRTWLQWNLGIAVHDYRQGVRACNIDTALLGGTTSANLITILTNMVHKPPVMPAGVGPVQSNDDPFDGGGMTNRAAFYCNRTLFTALDLQAQNKTNVLLQMQQWGTESVVTFRGIPIRCVDALVNTETRVV